jgi:hypothetical protein
MTSSPRPLTPIGSAMVSWPGRKTASSATGLHRRRRTWRPAGLIYLPLPLALHACTPTTTASTTPCWARTRRNRRFAGPLILQNVDVVAFGLRPRRGRRSGTGRLLRRLLRRWPLEVRATGSKWRLETLARTLELAAGAHREHRRAAGVHHLGAVMATTVVVLPTVAAGMRSEDEAGEEDDGDDKDHACHDADPSGHRGDPAMAVRLGGYGRRCGRRRCGGGYGASRRFGGRRCFTHEPEHASGTDAPVLNWI